VPNHQQYTGSNNTETNTKKHMFEKSGVVPETLQFISKRESRAEDKQINTTSQQILIGSRNKIWPSFKVSNALWRGSTQLDLFIFKEIFIKNMMKFLPNRRFIGIRNQRWIILN
jgi:hypothetical protein